MPAAPAAPPPAAPSAPSPASAPAPSSRGTPAAAPTRVAPSAPVPAANPFDDAFARLDTFAKGTDGTVKPPAGNQGRAQAPEPATRPATPPSVEQPRPGDEPLEEGEPAAPETPAAPDPNKPPEKTEQQQQQERLGNKANPWTLVETFKQKYHAAQAEAEQLRKAPASKEITERMTAIEQRNAELENEIAFVDYSKSNEFKEQYEKPYTQAWTDALHALNGLKVQFQNEETGTIQSRDLSPTDLANLANMDPAAARMEIRARFQEDYAEVKHHVDKIRALSDAQNRRLDEQRTKGGEWRKQQHEEQTRHFQAMLESNVKTWNEVNAEAAKKYSWLQPVEGDTVRNEKLERATAFVDQALAAKAHDPNLTVEQRHEAIRKHAALRNRAIGFTTLSHDNKMLKAKLAEVEAKLRDYEASAPTNGEGRGQQGAPVTGGDEIDAALAGLTKYAR